MRGSSTPSTPPGDSTTSRYIPFYLVSIVNTEDYEINIIFFINAFLYSVARDLDTLRFKRPFLEHKECVFPAIGTLKFQSVSLCQ